MVSCRTGIIPKHQANTSIGHKIAVTLKIDLKTDSLR